MDALFIVPMLVSNNVNEKLIPALAKLVERNILLLNSTLFKDAITLKYTYRRSTPNSYIRDFLKMKENTELTSFPILNIGNYVLNENELNLSKIGDGYILNEAINDYNKDLALYDKNQNVVRAEDYVKNYMKHHNMGLKNEEDKRKNDLQQAKNEFDMENYEKRQDFEKERFQHVKDINNFRQDLEVRKYVDEKEKKEKERLRKDLEVHIKQMEFEIKREKNPHELLKLKSEAQKAKIELDLLKYDKRMSRNVRSADLNYKFGQTFTDMSKVEIPKDISFFNQISIEPTYMEIPIEYHATRNPDSSIVGKRVLIGIKCIPYRIDNMSNIIKLMKHSLLMNDVERLFKKAVRRINLSKWLWPMNYKKRLDPSFHKQVSNINKNADIDSNKAVLAVEYTPNMDELNSKFKLAKLLSTGKASSWSTLVVLSSFDLQDEDMKQFINNYKKLTAYGFGDIIITNETKESAYFCSPKLNQCQEIQYEYLKKILNLENILDYSAVSGRGGYKPF